MLSECAVFDSAKQNDATIMVELPLTPSGLATTLEHALDQIRSLTEALNETQTELKSVSALTSDLKIEVQKIQSTIIDVPSSLSKNAGPDMTAGIVAKALTPVDPEASGEAETGESLGPDEAYFLTPSVWDAAIFFGTGVYPFGSSLSLAILFVMNIFIQWCFCGIVFTSLVTPQITQETVQGLQAWRTMVAHDDKYVSSDGVSLASRVCGGDPILTIASGQADQLSQIQGYLPHLGDDDPSLMNQVFQGWLMCCLALVCWFCCCLSEWNSLFDFVHVFMTMPYSKTEVQPDGEGLRITSLGIFHKGLVVFIFLQRAGLWFFLLYGGTLYLTTLLAQSDILLNAMALQFIMTIDEMIFDAMAPNQIKLIIDSARGYTHIYKHASFAPFWMLRGGVTCRVVLGPLAIALGIVIAWITRLDPLIRYLEDSNTALCDGLQSFSYYFDPANVTRLQLGLTSYDPDHSNRLSQYSAVENVWKAGVLDPLNWTFALVAPAHKYTTLSEMSSGLFTELNMDCRDFLEPSYNLFQYSLDDQVRIRNLWNVWPRYLAQHFDSPKEMTQCSDIMHFCTTFNPATQPELADVFRVAQMLCPVTCGCNSLLRPPFFTLGTCPAVCTTSPLQSEVNNADCSDATPGNNKWQALSDWTYAYVNITNSLPNMPFQHASWIVGPGGAGCGLFDTATSCYANDQNPNGAIYDTAIKGTTISMKLMTYLCPQACSCHKRDWRRETAGICPDMCSCPFPFPEATFHSFSIPPHKASPTQSMMCQVVWPYIETANQSDIYANITITEHCCYLMQTYTSMLNSAMRLIQAGTNPLRYKSRYSGVQENLCLPCRQHCLGTLWSLNFTGGKRLADSCGLFGTCSVGQQQICQVSFR